MRDRYYRIESASDLPANAALVRIWRHRGRPRARLQSNDEAMETDPDLALFSAALARVQHGLVAIFVLVEAGDLWQADWGDLVDYRAGRVDGRACLRTPARPAQN